MQPPALTELETRLASAEGEIVREELVARLQALEERLRACMAKGLPRSQFGLHQAVSEAVVAAREVLEQYPVAAPSGPVTPAHAPFPLSSSLC